MSAYELTLSMKVPWKCGVEVTSDSVGRDWQNKGTSRSYETNGGASAGMSVERVCPK